MKCLKIIIVFFVFYSFLSVLLYAECVVTELEKNQDIYYHVYKENTVERRIDKIGELLVEPVAGIKNGTENILLRNMARITHDEMNVNGMGRNNFNKRNAEGPKISLSF